MTEDKIYLKKIEKDIEDIVRMVDEAVKKLEKVAA